MKRKSRLSKPRIDLSPEVHNLLLAECAKRRIRPNAFCEYLIVEASSPEAKALVDFQPDQVPEEEGEPEEKREPPAKREPPGEKERESLFLAAWQKGLRSIKELEDETGIPHTTTGRMRKRLLKEGKITL